VCKKAKEGDRPEEYSHDPVARSSITSGMGRSTRKWITTSRLAGPLQRPETVVAWYGVRSWPLPPRRVWFVLLLGGATAWRSRRIPSVGRRARALRGPTPPQRWPTWLFGEQWRCKTGTDRSGEASGGPHRPHADFERRPVLARGAGGLLVLPRGLGGMRQYGAARRELRAVARLEREPGLLRGGGG